MSDELIHLRKFLTGVIGNAPLGIITLSEVHEISIINQNAADMLGYRQAKLDRLIDQHYQKAFKDIPQLIETLNFLVSQKKRMEANIDEIKIDGIVVNIRIRPLFKGALLIIEDITQRSNLENLLRQQARHDSLTALPNRNHFEEKAKTAIAKAIKHNLPGAIIFIDLDRFKPVNDSAGHAAGDQLLRHVGQILQQSVRDRDLVARLGGDEFAVLLEDCPIENAAQIADQMRHKINSFVFIYNDRSFSIGMSAGVCSFGAISDNLEVVINAADNACQIAKREGRNSVRLVDINRSEYIKNQQEIDWIPRIQNAIKEDKFILYKQKIESLKAGNNNHFELLLRYLDEDGSILLPGAFIQSAERYDLMFDIDSWVVENAFKRMSPDEFYAINLSGQTMKHLELADKIESLVKAHSVPASNIIFEITETAAIHNLDNCLKFMKQLKRIGIRFSLDDFGSGLSSFAYLKNLPVDYLKIDGSFVKDIADDSVSYAMVKAIADVGYAMKLETIAERVESAAIREKLQEIGVNYAQGFHIHIPDPL